jgi:vacuolar-type H+-ATPase subunit H
MADDKATTKDIAEEIADLEKKRQIIEGEDGSPITLIREREVEISGRVLSAKREADEIVGEARRRAADIVAAAQREADEGIGVDEIERSIREQADAQLEGLKESTEREARELEHLVNQRRDGVVQMVVEAVTGH